MKLPNGVEIFNATPHPLYFHSREWGEQVITVPSHGVINAQSYNEYVEVVNGVEYVTVKFLSKPEGDELIGKIRQVCPDAVIVGSMVAAQAYPGEVVAAIPWRRLPREVKVRAKLLRPDKFTIFHSEKEQ